MKNIEELSINQSINEYYSIYNSYYGCILFLFLITFGLLLRNFY